jgi:hypothetical protein
MRSDWLVKSPCRRSSRPSLWARPADRPRRGRRSPRSCLPEPARPGTRRAGSAAPCRSEGGGSCLGSCAWPFSGCRRTRVIRPAPPPAFHNRLSRGRLPGATPATLPYPMRRRLSSTSASRPPPGCRPRRQAGAKASASRRSVLTRRLRWAYIGASLGAATMTCDPQLLYCRAMKGSPRPLHITSWATQR